VRTSGGDAFLVTQVADDDTVMMKDIRGRIIGF